VDGGKMNRLQRRAMAMAAVVAVTVLAAAGGSSGAASAKPGETIRGQTITVLVPYKIPQDVISSFTKATGVKVNYVVTGWDATHSKLVVANTARTYIADVAEFDWSFTGQFAGAKWVEPLDSILPKPLLSDLASTDAAFKSGGKTYAACFSNDFRISIYNKKLFAKAGIKTFPTTFAALGKAADKLKAAGVQYPLSIPMAATEGGVTPWYLLTLANGGELFDNSFKPLFQKPGSAGYKALQWEALAVKKGWVSPGAVTLDDATAFDKFTAGQTAMVLATGPGNLETANDPSQSSIAGQAVAALVPGVTGPGASFGLPEGLSIPVTAHHKAAAAAFIEWWQKSANAIEIYKKEGNLPCGSSVISKLAANGQLSGGTVLSSELKLVKPLFPQGAPVWYSQFSSDAQGLLNAAVKGQMGIQAALSQLASKATGHATA
jgi:multiple sugar transport system substrate-binding protein